MSMALHNNGQLETQAGCIIENLHWPDSAFAHRSDDGYVRSPRFPANTRHFAFFMRLTALMFRFFTLQPSFDMLGEVSIGRLCEFKNIRIPFIAKFHSCSMHKQVIEN